MDIARIRKKFKETKEPEAKSGAEPEGRLQDEGDSVRELEVRVSREAEAPVGGEEKGLPPAPEDTVDAMVELLTFTLSREEFAFRIGDVHEIVRPQRITTIPKAEAHVLGITSLRGKIIPVIDLKKLLSLGDAGEDRAKQKIVVLKGPKGPIGAVIDRVIGVIRPLVSRIVETPAHLPEAKVKFIEGVAVVDGRFISILRLEETITL